MAFDQLKRNKYISIEEAIAAILNIYNPIDEHSNADFLNAMEDSIDKKLLEEEDLSKKTILQQISMAHFYRDQMYKHLKSAMEEEIRLAEEKKIESTLKTFQHLGQTKVDPQSAMYWGIDHGFYKFERNQISEYTTEYYELFMKVKKEFYDFGGEFFVPNKRPRKNSVTDYISELNNRVSSQISTSIFTMLNEKEINNDPVEKLPDNARQFKNGKQVK